MEKQEYLNIYQNENKHFFYRANHELFLSHVTSFASGRPQDLNILDAGCGTGLLTKKLKKFGRVVGVDISSDALRFSRKRGINVRKASVDKLPFKDSSFDLIVSMDVIYHNSVNDKKALREFFRVLKPGGILILRVPANKWLYSQHDKHVHTRHRYSKKELIGKLKKAGFKVDKISYINSTLFIPALLKVMVEKMQKTSSSSSISKINPTINGILFSLLSIENFLLKFTNLPFGIGLVGVARKV